MKKLLALALSLAMILTLTACGSSEKPAESNQPEAKKTIYVIVKVLGNQYWSVLQAGAENAGKDLGVDVVVVGTAAESDIEGQVRLLQDAVSAQAAGVVIGVVDSKALLAPVAEAYNSGTPIVLVDTAIEGDDYSAALMTDNYAAGEMAAKEMLRRLKESGLAEDKESVIAIQVGSTGSEAIISRLKGFNAVWDAEAPAAWKVLNDDIKVNDGDISKAVAFGQDFLTTYPDTLVAVFGPNNGSTVGFVTALTEAKRTDVVMVGFDLSKDMEAMIRSGEYQVSTMLQRQYFMGYDGVATALKLANGETVSEKLIDTGVLTVTPENIDNPEVQSVINP